MSPRTAALFRPSADHPELELTRAFQRPIEEVWRALATPERLADWMGVEWLGAPGPLAQGARFDYRFANTDMESRGRVLRLDPPRLLEHSWMENIPPGAVIRWRLDPEGEGCRLTLTHRLGSPDDGPRNAAGWTQLLESLAADLGEADARNEGGMDAWRGWRDGYARAFPPEATRDGRRIEVDGVPALRFERRLRHPVEAVWSALVDPERLAQWMQAPGSIVQPEAGGRFYLALDEGRYPMEGVITDWAPPHRLEFTWTEAEAGGDSLVRIELLEDGNGSRLTLTHILKRGGKLADFASGWHWHLDMLERVLDGAPVAMDPARISVLGKAYAATL